MRSAAERVSTLQALHAGDLAAAERAWGALRQSAPAEVDTWALGVTLAGWRGDREAASARAAQGREALARTAPDWLARHTLALAAGEAALRYGDLRSALPLLGEALGQTEWRPEHPAAVDALLALAGLHALHVAPRKARAQVERALARARASERAASSAPRSAATAPAALRLERCCRARWVELVVGLRVDGVARATAAHRAERLSRLWRAAGREPEALQLAADRALLLGDPALEREALRAAEVRGLGGVRSRTGLLREALTRRGAPARG